MELSARRLRTPEERVGMLPNASLPPPAAAAPSDEDFLVQGLIGGDERALARACDRLFTPMLRLAMSHVDTRAAAEEVVQETWLAAIRGIDRFESRSSVKTWLFHILRNIARTRGRRESRVRTFTDLQPLDGPLGGSDLPSSVEAGSEPLWSRTEDPEEDLLAGELAARINAAIQLLPARQQEVIVLRDVDGWSAEEVCNALGISQTNQRVLLHRARNRVRHELHGYLADNDCGDDEEALLR